MQENKVQLGAELCGMDVDDHENNIQQFDQQVPQLPIHQLQSRNGMYAQAQVDERSLHQTNENLHLPTVYHQSSPYGQSPIGYGYPMINEGMNFQPHFEQQSHCVQSSNLNQTFGFGCPMVGQNGFQTYFEQHTIQPTNLNHQHHSDLDTGMDYDLMQTLLICKCMDYNVIQAPSLVISFNVLKSS